MTAGLVGLNRAFGDNPIYMPSDGPHPSEIGNALMAVVFYDVEN